MGEAADAEATVGARDNVRVIRTGCAAIEEGRRA